MDTERKRVTSRGEKCSPVVVPDAIQRLKATFRNVGTAAAKKKGVSVSLHPTDIVIAAPRKNGNTWTKQVPPFSADTPYILETILPDCARIAFEWGYGFRRDIHGDTRTRVCSRLRLWRYRQTTDVSTSAISHTPNLPRCPKRRKVHCHHQVRPHLMHCLCSLCADGVRDPYDSALSLYHYWENWLFVSGELNLDDFVKYFWLGQEDDTRIPCQMQHTRE